MRPRHGGEKMHDDPTRARTIQRVLIADERAQRLRLMRELLAKPGVELISAQSAEEALQILFENPIAAAVLALRMQSLGGLDILRRLQRYSQLRPAAVLIISDSEREQAELLEITEAGAIDCMVEPIPPPLLQAKVERMLEYERQRVALDALNERAGRARSYFEGILNAAGEGILAFDRQDRVRYANPTSLRLLNLPRESVEGSSAAALFGDMAAEHRLQLLSALERCRSDGQEQPRRDAFLATAARESFAVTYCCSPLSGGSEGAVLVFNDVSRRAEIEERLRRQATTDGLTGLTSRAGAMQAVELALGRAKRQAMAMALLHIDIDQFRRINEAMGHDMGDRALTLGAERIRGALRTTDLVCRLGGDEFLAIVGELKESQEAGLAARHVLAAFEQPMPIAGEQIGLTVSIGIATYPESGQDAGSLAKAADTAMRMAKAERPGGYRFYSWVMNAKARARTALEAQLEAALDRNEFMLYYQPQVDVVSGEMIGCEALLRWHRTTPPQVAPEVFIPMLEESGGIEPVGQWILRTACQQLAQWREKRLVPDGYAMSINVSPRQLSHASFAADLAQAIAGAQLPASLIELEVPERSLMAGEVGGSGVLDELADLGVRLAVDDFGTGYASLTYLKRYRLQSLKIDKSFVGTMDMDAKDRAVATSIIRVARELGLRTVAQGVETPEQAAALRELNCDAAQGFYFSRPVGAAELEEALRRERPIIH